jgi:hypothetical protein
MRRLSKRWESLKRVTGARHLYRAFLPETGPPDDSGMCWGCIEAPSLDGPFRLEIWNHTESEWEFVQEFPTFKEAKAVGRLLAGVALNKNI